MSLQLDFFLTEEQCELAHIRKELTRIEESGHKVRRGTYAAINKLGKQIIEQEQRICDLEHKLFVMEKFIKEHINRD